MPRNRCPSLVESAMHKVALSSRPGFTLLEVLVALAILGLLIGLSLAGIHKVRETASRLRCANQLRQVGLAFHQHHNASGVLPSNGGWDGSQSIPTKSGGQTNVFTCDYALPQPWFWGVGDPQFSPQEQMGSWAFALLPFLEQESIYRARPWEAVVPTYTCPSRRPATAQPATNDVRGAYNGGGWNWGKIDYAANARLIPGRPECLTFHAVRDGLSNTILAGEKAMARENYTSGTWWWDEPFFLGGSDSTSRSGTGLYLDGAVPTLQTRENWGAAHAAGASFLFADGSVKTIHYGIDPNVLLALLTPAGGESMPEF